MSEHSKSQRPSIGRIVVYRGKLGAHAMRAAVVTCTEDTLLPEGGGEIPALSSATHVHLNVFTPSALGMFVEFDVPMATGPVVQPGEWAWPPRVS